MCVTQCGEDRLDCDQTSLQCRISYSSGQSRIPTQFKGSIRRVGWYSLHRCRVEAGSQRKEPPVGCGCSYTSSSCIVKHLACCGRQKYGKLQQTYKRLWMEQIGDAVYNWREVTASHDGFSAEGTMILTSRLEPWE